MASIRFMALGVGAVVALVGGLITAAPASVAVPANQAQLARPVDSSARKAKIRKPGVKCSKKQKGKTVSTQAGDVKCVKQGNKLVWKKVLTQTQTPTPTMVMDATASPPPDPPNPSPIGDLPTPTPTASTPCGVSAKPAQWDHVVWIVMENHGLSQVVGSPSAPYFNSLIGKCGLATNMHAITHPSLPNYIAMTSGSTQGVTDNADPAAHPLNVASIFSQLGTNGWRALNESMPSNCLLTSSGTYAVRHNPATYFTNIAGQCATQDVPLGVTPDISAPFTFITPNNQSNTHDTPVTFGDTWLSTFMPKIFNTTEYQAGRTLVVLTYDEDEGTATNAIATVMLAPSIGVGVSDATSYTHYSLLRTTQEMLNLPLLGNASSATSMRTGFGL